VKEKSRPTRTVVTADMNAGSTTVTSPVAEQRLGSPMLQQISASESIVNAAAVYLYRQARFQPILSLEPATLSWQLSEWNVGTMRRFSLTMDAIENRDAMVKCVTGKLKQSISRRTFDIVKVEGADSATADAHAKVLRDFYSNVECTNAIDRNVRGGFSMLLHQMMDAALKRYAVHEIVWKPIGDEANSLSATFVFVPLWFFENRTGSLRFCGNFAWDGIPLKDGNWMVTVGEGIMEPISCAWMYKTIATRDWLIYSEKHGMPGVVGKTPHGTGTPGWNAIEDSVKAVAADFSAVIGIQDTIEAIQFGSTGNLPYPPLVEYMDKTISALARGADLSTISAGSTTQGQGASVQSDEGDMIEQHYGQVLTETLNRQVDPHVIRWHFGVGAEPCAYVKVTIPAKKDINLELAIDSALEGMGIKQSKTSVCERYSRAEASPEQVAAGDVVGGSSGEEIIPVSEERRKWLKEFRDGQTDSKDSSTEDLAKDRMAAYRETRNRLKASADNLEKSASNELKPLVRRLRKIVEMPNDEHFSKALRALRVAIPRCAEMAPRTIENANGLLEVFETANHPWHNE
jgi:phage gp29-like protein